MLGIRVGDPLMAIERVAFDADDQPVEYSTDLFRGDRTRVVAWAHSAAKEARQLTPLRSAGLRPGSGTGWIVGGLQRRVNVVALTADSYLIATLADPVTIGLAAIPPLDVAKEHGPAESVAERC